MKKVLITGSNGFIGKHLSDELSGDYDLTLVDLPKIDVRNYSQLLQLSKGHDVIIHLAWNTNTENYLNHKTDSGNVLMFSNVYKVAEVNSIPRVIMASSVHADSHIKLIEKNTKKLISPSINTVPDSPYGETKISMEKLGRDYSKKGLEVICIRIGAISERPQTQNKVLTATWLSFNDFYSLIKEILKAPKIPNNFFIVYGVSNNGAKIQSYKNPLGWEPKDDATKFTI